MASFTKISAILLDDASNAIFTFACVIFVLPHRKLKKYQYFLFAVALLLSYGLMRRAYQGNDYFIGASFEYINFFLPLILLSKGDIWRNSFFRILFQMMAVFFNNMLYKLYCLFFPDFYDLKWFEGFYVADIKKEAILFCLNIIGLLPAVLILRFFVRRRKRDAAKIYAILTMAYLAAGFVNGIIKVMHYTNGNSSAYADGFKYFVAVNVALVFLLNAYYTRSERVRLAKENDFYLGKISDMEKGLSDENDVFAKTAEYKEFIRKLEETACGKGVCLNYINRLKPGDHSRLTELLEKVFAYEFASGFSLIDFSVTENSGFYMINISGFERKGKAATEAAGYRNEIEEAVKDTNGTVIFENDELSLMIPREGILPRKETV